MGRGKRHSVRQFPRGALDGAASSSPLLGNWNRVSPEENYPDPPQGPPRLEDGEENPEALEIAKMALGQIGKDSRGVAYQLIGWTGGVQLLPSGKQIPEKLILRAVRANSVFYLEGKKRETLVRKSVGYPMFSDETLEAYALSKGRGDALEAMSEDGFWDMRVASAGTTYTQIGSVILTDGSNGKSTEDYQFPFAAADKMEWIAAREEAAVSAREWLSLLERGKLAPPESEIDKASLAIRTYLVSGGDKKQLLLDLKSVPEAKGLARAISQLPDPPPSTDSSQFRELSAPIWIASLDFASF